MVVMMRMRTIKIMMMMWKEERERERVCVKEWIEGVGFVVAALPQYASNG